MDGFESGRRREAEPVVEVEVVIGGRVRITMEREVDVCRVASKALDDGATKVNVYRYMKRSDPEDARIRFVGEHDATLQCGRCGRPMPGSTPYDGACECGGLIEVAP